MSANNISNASVEDDSTFDGANASNLTEPIEYSNIGSDSFYNHTDDGGASSVTGGGGNYLYRHQDATEIVHEMHLALLYLLSNPDEFKKALNAHPPSGATTLDEWNAEIEDEDEESVMTSGISTALPFIVFADDAEVVLPQAHTASQLFGIEKVEGIELEAAAGIPALSQLFLRWLALMPGGDHLNIIDPPGLTVMKIAGGRYRVTAAHRVVWTWMNEFFPSLPMDEGIQEESSVEQELPLQIGDLVTLTIVDVFETDCQGKLLSYCPTFDNRAIRKTNQTSETIRKSSRTLFSILGKATNAVAKSEVNKQASRQISKMGLMQHAKNVAENMKHKVDEAVKQKMNSPSKEARTERATSAAELYASAASTDVEDSIEKPEPEVQRI